MMKKMKKMMMKKKMMMIWKSKRKFIYTLKNVSFCCVSIYNHYCSDSSVVYIYKCIYVHNALIGAVMTIYLHTIVITAPIRALCTYIYIYICTQLSNRSSNDYIFTHTQQNDNFFKYIYKETKRKEWWITKNKMMLLSFQYC